MEPGTWAPYCAWGGYGLDPGAWAPYCAWGGYGLDPGGWAPYCAWGGYGSEGPELIPPVISIGGAVGWVRPGFEAWIGGG